MLTKSQVWSVQQRHGIKYYTLTGHKIIANIKVYCLSVLQPIIHNDRQYTPVLLDYTITLDYGVMTCMQGVT